MVIGLKSGVFETGVDHKPSEQGLFFPYKKAILLSIANFLGGLVRQKTDYLFVVFYFGYKML